MTTVRIDFPDDQAAILTAKAAAKGLSLEDWLRSLASQETPQQPKSRYSLAELIRSCDQDAPLSAEDQAWMNAPAVGRESP